MKRKKMAEKSLTVQEAYDQFQRSNLTKGLSEGTSATMNPIAGHFSSSWGIQPSR